MYVMCCRYLSFLDDSDIFLCMCVYVCIVVLAERSIDDQRWRHDSLEHQSDSGDQKCLVQTRTVQFPDHNLQSGAPLFPAGFTKPVLTILQTKLSKRSLKSQPTDKHALVWCLWQLTVSY